MIARLRPHLRRSFPAWAKYRRFGRVGRTPLAALRQSRDFEPELLLIPDLVAGAPGLCLDVGAHVGEYCYALERCVGPRRVHAIEPNPESCRRLRDLFPEIRVWECALSGEIGNARLKVPLIEGRRFATRGTLAQIEEPGESGQEWIAVETTTLDSLLSSLGNPPLALVKIDVEGHERSVIRGAREALAGGHPVLIVEIEARHHREPIEACFRDVEALGYRGFYLDLPRWCLAPLEEFDAAAFQRYEAIKTASYVNNFLFLPESRADALRERLEARLAAEAPPPTGR